MLNKTKTTENKFSENRISVNFSYVIEIQFVYYCSKIYRSNYLSFYFVSLYQFDIKGQIELEKRRAGINNQ